MDGVLLTGRSTQLLLYQFVGPLDKDVGQVGFIRVGKIRRQKADRPGSEELKPILENSKSVVRNHPGCPTLIGPIFRYAHLMSKGSELIHRKTLGHSIYNITDYRYPLEADLP